MRAFRAPRLASAPFRFGQFLIVKKDGMTAPLRNVESKLGNPEILQE